MTSTVHFILGYSAAASLREAYPDACVICMADPLSYGRCRFDESTTVEAWLRARHDWWQESEGDDSREAEDSGPHFIGAFENALVDLEEAVLWLADGTTERLHACWLAAILPESVLVKLAVPPNRWPHRSIQTIGIVRAETLAATVAVEMDSNERARLTAIWKAFVEETPEQFFSLLEGSAPASICHGLAELKNRLPSKSDGLTFWEREILMAVANNPGRPCTYAICSLVFRESRDCPGDSLLYEIIYWFEEIGVLEEVADGDPALSPNYTHLPLGEIASALAPEYFRTTTLGEEILAGDHNCAAIADSDCWFGGTHLTNAGEMWWLEGQTVVRSTSE